MLIKKLLLVLAVSVSFLVAGCATGEYGRSMAGNATIGGLAGAALGAAVGAAFGGGPGAAKGAAIGATSGVLLGASSTPYPQYIRPDNCGGYYRSYTPPTPQERVEMARRQGFAQGREEAIRREEQNAYKGGYYSGNGTIP